MNLEWIEQIIELIKNGVINKAEKDNVTIYKCGTVIRIDIKL